MTDATPTPRRLTVVGDALIDELRDPHGSREFVGGAALNVAVGLAVLGHDATLVAMLGDDEPAAHIRAYLRDYGVRLVESPSLHGTSRAVSDRSEGGEPRYEFNEAARRRSIRFDDATRAALDEADLVVVSCYPFDDSEQYASLVEAIELPRERLVVDGNPRSGMLSDRGAFLANLEDFATRSLLVKVGDDDAELLLGDSLDTFVRRLQSGREAPGAILATAGRHGAAVHVGDEVVREDIVELPGPIIDTMGAGDATLSAVVHHIAVHGVPRSTDAWSATLREAMTIAAATVRHEGALLRVPAHDTVYPS
ncbi:PfkB family carbohydrate kinase [Agromyces sp. SYSU K20354]|uniref:carbohydrate kinase family protein n=1 Tax=Agromyces cavernae TaxID=2898659 RepID=UPI001E48FFCC|nr:PfkB family carbohydrate kinase [Agromyces cavernae]MCD2440731.1 PfkB family carbohydrate kinase [Agromyces cavernae]